MRCLPGPAKARHASCRRLRECEVDGLSYICATEGIESTRHTRASPSAHEPPLLSLPPFCGRRLAAAGNAEAIEALRASGSSNTSFSSSEPGSETGQSDEGAAGVGGGFTPLTVLPVLLALVGAGYCLVNDLVPQEWLLWVGVGGDGAGTGPGGSTRAEGRNSGEEEGDAWSLSPLLRTLSRVGAVVPVGSTNAGTDAAPTEIGGGGLPESGTASTAPAGEDGRGGGAGWSFGGWWKREDEAALAVEESDGAAVVVGGGKESAEDFALVEGHAGDDADERQQQKPPHWLRWRAPPHAPPGPELST